MPKQGVPITRFDAKMRGYLGHRTAVLADIARIAESAKFDDTVFRPERYGAFMVASQHWNQEARPYEFFIAACDGFMRISTSAQELSPHASKIVRVSPWSEEPAGGWLKIIRTTAEN